MVKTLGTALDRDFRNNGNDNFTEHESEINNIQAQVNQLVVDGDSSPEAAQARVELDGTVHTTLKEHTDAIHNKIGNLKKDRVSVLDYGVNGDGTDETTKIQNALDYVNSIGGGILFFPKPSSKYVAVNLTVYNNTIIQGDGWQTIIEQKSTAGTSDCLFNIISTNNTGDVSQNKKNIVFRDIQLKGTVTTDAFSQYKHLIQIYGASNVLIDNVQFTGWIGDGVYIGYGGVSGIYHNENITIRDCLFDGVNKGNRNAISIIDCNGLLIDNNKFINTTKSDMPGAIDIEPNTGNTGLILNHITIRNNKFSNIGGNVAAIGMYIPIASGTFTNGNPKNFTVENNEMSSVFTGIHIAQYQTADIAESVDGLNIKILNNKVKGATDRGFWLYGVKGILLQNNLFEDIANSSRIGWSLTGRNCVGVKLIENTFKKCATTDGEAIKIFTCERLDLIGNTFDDCGATGTTYGICLSFESGTTSQVRMIRNTIVTPTGKTTGAIAKKAGAVLTPSTNVFKENYFGNFLNLVFDADLVDYGYTSSTFDAATLPNSFKKGITTLKLTGSTGLPTGYTDGILITHRATDLQADNEYVTQTYHPKNAGGASLTDTFYRKSNDNANTWGAWYKVSSVLA